MPEGNKIDLSGDGGVLKEILEEGKGTETPHTGCTVSLHYTGRLVDGTEFDSSVGRNEPFEFPLGKGECLRFPETSKLYSDHRAPFLQAMLSRPLTWGWPP